MGFSVCFSWRLNPGFHARKASTPLPSHIPAFNLNLALLSSGMSMEREGITLRHKEATAGPCSKRVTDPHIYYMS